MIFFSRLSYLFVDGEFLIRSELSVVPVWLDVKSQFGSEFGTVHSMLKPFHHQLAFNRQIEFCLCPKADNITSDDSALGRSQTSLKMDKVLKNSCRHAAISFCATR